MTESLEDYLEMVSFLADGGEVRVTDIAARLKVSKPSVLTALHVLEERELVRHERYRGVTLTEKGIGLASEIRERHDFLTSFLRDILGVSKENAEKDACKMEHVLSEETFRKMKHLARALISQRGNAGAENFRKKTAKGAVP